MCVRTKWGMCNCYLLLSSHRDRFRWMSWRHRGTPRGLPGCRAESCSGSGLPLTLPVRKLRLKCRKHRHRTGILASFLNLHSQQHGTVKTCIQQMLSCVLVLVRSYWV